MLHLIMNALYVNGQIKSTYLSNHFKHGIVNKIESFTLKYNVS